MLTLSQYGVTLKRLTIDDIEEVRLWRNENYIKDKMIYSKEITPQMQKKWFDSINNKYNYYFVIIDSDGDRVGLINSKNINLDEKVGEGGIFIADKKVWKTVTPVIASMILINFSVVLLNSFDKSIVKVLKSNSSAIEYNKRLGYFKSDENNGIIQMKLTKESYIEATKMYSQILKKFHPNHSELNYSGTPSELNIDEINNLLINKGVS